jgi:2-aminoadipate transaminase
MALISKGDGVAVEAPTYLGALQAFAPYGPTYIRLDMDDDGLIPESLEKAVSTGSVKLIYLVPTFQNPTGRTIPLSRRKEIARILKAHNALLVEDDPYSDLRYKGRFIPPIQTLAPKNVIYVSTLSKVFAPGLRIGFCVAPEPIKKCLVMVKQGIDLHTSSFNQALAAEYITGGYLDRQIPKIRNLYKPKLAAMLAALAAYFPKDFKWSKPEGGMFVWVEGPKHVNMEEIYKKSVEKQAAFVPGRFFFAHPGEGRETMRLNFSMADESAIRQAVKILGDLVQK